MRTVVIGLGNPVLGDDGVGWSVIDRLAALQDGRIAGVELDRLAVGGLTLMERLAGFERAILVDALVTGRAPAGTVTVVPLTELSGHVAAHLDSVHDTPIGAALEAGRAMGARLPASIVVVGIEVDRVDTFHDGLSRPVSEAIPVAVDRVLTLLEAAPIRTGHVAPAARPA